MVREREAARLNRLHALAGAVLLAMGATYEQRLPAAGGGVRTVPLGSFVWISWSLVRVRR
ncbi:hypothetical protein [Streptomyces sp. NPDC057336]|uniref:hypothetical protein n=1 Tax=Streptomyces sp. NPDC057336 TaxID=3346102 RepID=UPI00363E1F8F